MPQGRGGDPTSCLRLGVSGCLYDIEVFVIFIVLISWCLPNTSGDLFWWVKAC